MHVQKTFSDLPTLLSTACYRKPNIFFFALLMLWQVSLLEYSSNICFHIFVRGIGNLLAAMVPVLRLNKKSYRTELMQFLTAHME